jgi:5'-nucleotidase
VVAPQKNESGSSQSARVYWKEDDIRVYEVAIGEKLTGYAIDGTPTDCVFLGLKIFGKEQPFDFVVSGINHGANIGIAYYYSGTVGAAFEALVNGIPAIAVSQSGGREDLDTTANFAAHVVQKVIAQPLTEGVLVSINVPNGEIGCIAVVPPGDYPWDVELHPAEKIDGDTMYNSKRVDRGEQEPGRDVRAYLDGCITVTPFQLDRTHHPTIQTIAGWEPALESFLD